MSTQELQEATDHVFDEGEKQGPECYFNASEYASMVSVSTGLNTVADHLNTEKIRISGLDAIQGESQEGDQCLVDVTLEPNAPVDTLSTSITGADPTGDPCQIAIDVAEKAIPHAKG